MSGCLDREVVFNDLQRALPFCVLWLTPSKQASAQNHLSDQTLQENWGCEARGAHFQSGNEHCVAVRDHRGAAAAAVMDSALPWCGLMETQCLFRKQMLCMGSSFVGLCGSEQ